MDKTQKDATLDELLESGRQTLAAGDRAAAHEIWRVAAVAHPYDERVWLALLQVVERSDDRQVCLENIIAINPLNTEARRQLRAIKRDRRLKQESRRTATVQRLPRQASQQTAPPDSVLTRAIVIGVIVGLTAVILGIALSVAIYGGFMAAGVP